MNEIRPLLKAGYKSHDGWLACIDKTADPPIQWAETEMLQVKCVAEEHIYYRKTEHND